MRRARGTLALVVVLLSLAPAARAARIGEVILRNAEASPAWVGLSPARGAPIEWSLLPPRAYKFMGLPNLRQVRVTVERGEKPALAAPPAPPAQRDRESRGDALARAVFGAAIARSQEPREEGPHETIGDNPSSQPASAPSDHSPRRGEGSDLLGVLIAQSQDPPASAPTPAETPETTALFGAGGARAGNVNGVQVLVSTTDDPNDPCAEIRRRLSEARARRAAVSARLDAARGEAERAEADRIAAEEELRAAERRLSAAERPPDEGDAYIEDATTGRRVTSRDLRLRSRAGRAAWDDYRAERISADELARRWREQGEDGALDRLRREDAAVREAERRSAEEGRDAARRRVEESRARRDAKRAAADRLTAEAAEIASEIARLIEELARCERKAQAGSGTQAAAAHPAPQGSPTQPPPSGGEGTRERDPGEESDEGGDPPDEEPGDWAGGVEDGVCLDCCELMKRVWGEISISSFGRTARGRAILDVVWSYLCGDVTFVPTVDGPPLRSGRVFPQTPDDAPGPGEASYERTMQMGIPGLAGFYSEEIYIGVDASSQGIAEASRHPRDYYICCHEGQLVVIKKADLIHALVHEGLHAAQGGAYNQDGRAPVEEEQDAFDVGNEACRAMGVEEAHDRPSGTGAAYGTSSNPDYRPYTGE